MIQKSWRLLAVVLALVAAPSVHAQYLTDSDAQKRAASEKDASRQRKIDAVLGKTFWYRPGTSDTLRTEFYEAYGRDKRFSYVEVFDFSGKFFLTKETSFKVLAADFKKIQVEFEDGKIAYLKAYSLADYGDYPLIEHLYPGPQRAMRFQNYIYPEPPFKIENPSLFVALDEIVGKKFWYRPIPHSNAKLPFTDAIQSESAIVIRSYKIASDTIDIQVQLDDGSPRVLKIEKAKLISSSRTGLPFIYVNKDKSVPDHEYLYPGPPGEVIAAEEAAIAAQVAALAKEKAELAEQRNRVTKDAMAALAKELKAAPRSFEVRGLNLGRDHLQDIADAVGYQAGKGTDVEGFPDTRKEIGSDGGVLYFYRGILFMASYDDLQDSLDIRAAMDKLEAKFKGKFAKVPQQKSRDGNTETTTVSYRMNIGGFGVADVQLSSSRPIVRSVCISDIARQMQLNIRLGIKNYSSLSDRVDSECKETLNPTQLVFIHKPIEALINARATAQRQANARQEAADKLKSASEKASKF